LAMLLFDTSCLMWPVELLLLLLLLLCCLDTWLVINWPEVFKIFREFFFCP
jgi:hypothetical protein